jgi:type I restriction enzyme S subunit
LSIKKEIDSQSYGTAQKNINLEVLNNIVMQIPPLAEQQRIVERLDALSENIRKYEEIQRQIISECDALKQALLRQVFE